VEFPLSVDAILKRLDSTWAVHFVRPDCSEALLPHVCWAALRKKHRGAIGAVLAVVKANDEDAESVFH